MSYTKNSWSRGDVITSAKLNNIEAGIESISNTTDTINETVNDISSSVEEMSGNITALGNSVDEVSSAASANTSSIGELGDSIANLTNSINALIGSMSGIPERLSDIEDTVRNLKKTDVMEVTTFEENISDLTKDVVLKSATLPEGKSAVTGKTVELNGVSASAAHTDLKGTNEVAIVGVTTSGNLAKSVSNSAWSVNTDGEVVVKNCNFAQTGYNCLEIGLSSTAPKKVLVENCTFGDTSNNSILVFATQENATVTVKDCTFGNVSDMIRLSNRTNVAGVIVNLVNCSIAATGSDLSWPLILCEDYQAGTGAEIKAANRFAPEKITINIINCSIGGKKITAPEDMATICGTNDANNIITVWNNYENSTVANKAISGFVAYGDGSRYPRLNIS